MRSAIESLPHAPDGRLQRFLQDVTARLERLHETEAIGRLNRAGVSGRLPPDAKLLGWLARTIGAQATLRLITSYARQPCFYCRNGLEPCDSCDGHGYWSEGGICVQCLGLGVARCDFCAGSGRVTYDAVPSALQAAVAVHRTKEALACVRHQLAQPVPSVSDAEPIRALRESGKALCEVDKALGLIENALLLDRALPGPGLQSRAELERIVRSGVRCAAAGRSRIHELVRTMAVSARLLGESSALEPRRRGIAARQAMFYQSLLGHADALSGTGFERPFLGEAFSSLEGKVRRASRPGV